MRNERGSAMVIAMLVLFLAGAVSAVILERGKGVDAATRHDRAAIRAFHAAEGALAVARHRIARDAGYAGETVAIGGVAVAIEVDGWAVALVAPGCRIDAVLAPTAGLPHVVSWRRR